jgi:hypothetical protein
MPPKSPGHDSRMITYRTLPRSSTPYQRVNVGECTAWVPTNLEFDLKCNTPTKRPRPGRTEIQRIFHVPFAQSQVSRSIKLVDDWLQSVKADSSANRAKRCLTVGPSRNEPSMPGTGKRLARKEVGDRDD